VRVAAAARAPESAALTPLTQIQMPLAAGGNPAHGLQHHIPDACGVRFRCRLLSLYTCGLCAPLSARTGIRSGKIASVTVLASAHVSDHVLDRVLVVTNRMKGTVLGAERPERFW
jgi:hypothetical protein